MAVSLFCFGLLIALPVQGQQDAEISRTADVDFVYKKIFEKLIALHRYIDWVGFRSGSYDGGIVLMPMDGKLRIGGIVRKLGHLEIRTIPCCIDSEPWGVALFASDWPDNGAMDTIFIVGDMKKRLSKDEMTALADAAADALISYLDQHLVQNK